MLELTSPWEENLGKRHKQKMEKYNQLVIDLEQGKHNGIKWNAQLLCVEIGARGALHELAWGRMCSTFGIRKKTRKALRDAMQDSMQPFYLPLSLSQGVGSSSTAGYMGAPSKGPPNFAQNGFCRIL